MAAVRLRDLAAELGLDISTVSRALRGDRRVRPETRERITRLASSLGYRANLRARALAEGRSRTVWLVLPGLERPVERECAVHAGRWLFDRGYDLLLAPHRDDPRAYARILDRLASGGADGALLIPGDVSPSDAPPGDVAAELPLLESGLPFAYLDRSVPGVRAPVATTDNEAAGRALASAAAGAAARSGAALASAVDAFRSGRNPVEAARSRGWRAGMAGLGVPISGLGGGPGPIAVAASTQEEIEAALRDLGDEGRSGPFVAAAFDRWEPRGGPLFAAFVAIQDFRTMAYAAVELLAEGLASGVALETREVLVPLLELRSVGERGMEAGLNE